MIKSDKKGFTLIELLLVISIISLLASIILVSFDNAKKKARDGIRLQNLFDFINAMEQYKIAFGEYPGEGDAGGAHISPKCPSDIKNDLLKSGFLTPMIADPIDDADCNNIRNTAGGDEDKLFFYGWDSYHCCEGEWCVSINRLETKWAVDLLKERFGTLHAVTGGGDANIGTGDDFNYCFKMR